jgi:hypothetical protein
MQAIVTKFFGPTNHRGARIRVSAERGSKWVSWDYELGAEENHAAAAREAAFSWGWLESGWELRSGGMPDGTGNCHVLVNPERERRERERDFAQAASGVQ